MLKILIALILFVSIAHAETTITHSNSYRSKTVFRYRIQNRVVRPPERTRSAEVVEPAEPAIVTQVRQTYFRPPTPGTRTSSIESGGGTAATQTCGGLIEIGNRQGQCREITYDQDFLQVLQTEGLSCARRAGEQAFGFTPTRVALRTGEGQVSADRFSSNGKRSTHSVGRALDIFEVDLYNGQAHNSVRMHGSHMDQRGHRTFYSQFRDCWMAVVDSVQGGIAGTCGSGCLHFGSNAAHWDHMHISLPPLNSNRASYGLNCT